MLLPQFSLRLILLLTAVLAVVAWFGTQAVQGSHWAVGVSMGFVSTVIAIGVFAAMFFVIWLVSNVISNRAPTLKSLSNDNATSRSPRPIHAETILAEIVPTREPHQREA